MSFLSSLMNALPGAAAQGLAWGIMAIGVYITFRILDVADLTVDGSLATGGAVCVMLIRGGFNPGSPCCARCSPVCWQASSPVFFPHALRYSGHSRRYPDAACAVFDQSAHHGQQGKPGTQR